MTGYRVDLNGRFRAALAGCYDARRAAALSGVPVSTVYYWARKDVVVPTVSPTRQKLWSYADLLALRIVYWLRHPKPLRDSVVPASPMPQVREALDELERCGLDIWAEEPHQSGTPLLVNIDGRVYLGDGWAAGTHGQLSLVSMLDLLGPFGMGGHGPDLVRPRPSIRIVPGKVSGEPHLVGSRITTKSVAAVYRRFGDLRRVEALYPHATPETIEQAIDLETALAA